MSELEDLGRSTTEKASSFLRKPTKGQVAVAAVATGVGLAVAAYKNREKIADKIFGDPKEGWEDKYSGEFSSQTIDFGELGKVAFRDMTPSTLRPNGEIPMIIMGGWGMNEKAARPVTAALVDKGQRAIPFDIVGEGKGMEGGENSSKEINRQAELLKLWLESRPEEKVHLVGTSLTALVVLKMIENNPHMAEKMASVVLVSPVGLAGDPEKHDALKRSENLDKPWLWRDYSEEQEGEENNEDLHVPKPVGGFKKRAIRALGGEKLLKLLERQDAEHSQYLPLLATEEDKANDEKYFKLMGRAGISHPKRAFDEIIAISKADEYDTLQRLQDMGIKVGIIQGAHDLLNSSRGLTENIAREAASNLDVEPEYLGPDGIEQIPDELQIRDGDGEAEVLHKRKEILRIKSKLRETENSVPLSSERIVAGGHEVGGSEAMASYLIHEVDFLVTDHEKIKAEVKEKQDLENARQQLAGEIETPNPSS